MPKSLFVLAFFCALPIARAAQSDYILPAGTLLNCTLDEPNFSSKTAQRGDPVLCYLHHIELFGRPLIPQGAYLSARLKDFRDPGHFVGKGWMQLEFTSMTLPGGIFPMDAKVISAGSYRVDGEGKVRGHGHPVRDAVEWTIPVLWPVKVLTLPARGPRPTLKGETRIELRLMDDMAIPASALSSLGAMSRSSFEADVVAPTATAAPPPARLTRRVLTLLALQGGRVYLVADYWVDRGYVDYTTGAGALEAVPLDIVDLALSQRLNAERGVSFVLTARNRY